MLYGMFGCFVNLCAVLFYFNVVSLVLLICFLSAPKCGVPLFLFFVKKHFLGIIGYV